MHRESVGRRGDKEEVRSAWGGRGGGRGKERRYRWTIILYSEMVEKMLREAGEGREGQGSGGLKWAKG